MRAHIPVLYVDISRLQLLGDSHAKTEFALGLLESLESLESLDRLISCTTVMIEAQGGLITCATKAGAARTSSSSACICQLSWLLLFTNLLSTVMTRA